MVSPPLLLSLSCLTPNGLARLRAHSQILWPKAASFSDTKFGKQWRITANEDWRVKPVFENTPQHRILHSELLLLVKHDREREGKKKNTGLRNRAPKTDQWKGSCLFLLLAVIKYQAAESCASFRLKAILVNLSHTKSTWWLRINNCLMDALANGQSVFLWSRFKAVHWGSAFTTFKFTLAWGQTLSIFCDLLIRFMLNLIWRYSPIFHTIDLQLQQLIN